MKKRPFNGTCPYCYGRMVLGLHGTSWVIGLISGLAPLVIYLALLLVFA